MKSAVKSTEKLLSKTGRLGLRSYKQLYQQFVAQRSAEMPSMLFILGCQRSGTTLLVNIFERDMRSKLYREFSELSSLDKIEGIRFNPLPMIKATIEQNPAPFVVLKPLVESQNAPELLDFFPTAKALWVYRHYRDVAASNLNKFGFDNGVDDLAPIVVGDTENWRSERVSSETKEIVRNYYHPDMNPHDAAALFWFVRNQLYFDLQLSEHPKMMLVKYEELVRNPLDMLQRIYAFVPQPFPGQQIIRNVHASSIGKGQRIELDAEIDALCNGLLAQLDQSYYGATETPREKLEQA